MLENIIENIRYRECNIKWIYVSITLPEDANIYASEYKLYLPDKKEFVMDGYRLVISTEEYDC